MKGMWYGNYVMVTSPPEDDREKLNTITEIIGELIKSINVEETKPDYDTIQVIVHAGMGVRDPLNQNVEDPGKNIDYKGRMTVGIKYREDETCGSDE